METQEIKLKELIIGKHQHRTQSVGSEIDELATNIKARGLLQPIRVVSADSPNDGKYEIIMGQRRFLAVKKLGWETITAIVSEKKESYIDNIGGIDPRYRVKVKSKSREKCSRKPNKEKVFRI